ncbi:hypothetical protein ACHAXS_008332 [Conticribra weissflogii]
MILGICSHEFALEIVVLMNALSLTTSPQFSWKYK